MVTVEARSEDSDGGGVGLDDFRDWTDRLRTAELAGHQTRERTLRSAGSARIVDVATVTENFFQVLGLPAEEGVAPQFTAGDARVVISTRLARGFSVTPGVPAVGQPITIGDRRYEVAGVMPAAFAFPTAAVDAWVSVPAVVDRFSGSYELLGRLKDGMTLAQIQEDASRVVRDLNSDNWNALVRTLEGELLDETRPAIQVSLGAAALVLVVALVNTFTLVMGRSVARGREFALRLALGAGLGRLVRGAVIEGVVIASGGLMVGLFLAWAGLRVFLANAAGVLPRVSEVGLDLPALLSIVGVSFLVALACGGASASGAVRRTGADVLRGTPLTGTPVNRRLRSALVAAQLALSIVLLTGAGLLARSVGELLAEDGGFEPERVLTAKLLLSDAPLMDDAAQAAFVNRLLSRVRGLPGVEAAGIGSTLPPTDAPTSMTLSYRSDTRDDTITLKFGAVTSGFFEALGTPLQSGRHFVEQDERGETADAIISESTARFMFPNDDSVGRTSQFDIPILGMTRDTTFLGVVDDIKYQGLDAPRAGALYVPWQLRPMGLSYLVIRTNGDPTTLIVPVRDLITQLDPTLPLPDVRTLNDHVAASIADRRLHVVPAVTVAGLALVVTMVGLFGTLGRSVVERRHELSIRAAVGASPRRLVRLVLRGSVSVTALGLAIGLPVAAGVGRGLSSLLYGVSPYDPWTFAGVTGVVLLASLTASLIPARRAARLDPLIALKGE